MAIKKRFLFLMTCWSLILFSGAKNPAPVTPLTKFTEEQKTYFISLYRDSWNYLATYVEPLTGVPYDSSARQPATSMSNIGFYLASTAIAFQTGLADEADAKKRIERILDALEKIEKWKGFPRPWVLVRSLKPTHGEEFSYDSHMAVLLGGLVIAQNTFEDFNPRIRALISQMRFQDLYDEKTGWLKGGYNVKKNDFAIFQAWGHWHYKYFASTVRLLSFYGIAKGAIPEEHWFRLLRPVQERNGIRFFETGYEEPGLADQYIPGLFLDERNTPMGTSQKNYAQYQIRHAEDGQLPVWGWSSCQTPQGRYLGAGEMRDEIVAPHASILASIYFPQETYENLKKLETLGANPPLKNGELETGFGFVDSVNCKSGETADEFLTPNHGMTFLSLANLLYDGIVWKTFAKDPVIQKGLQKLQKSNSEPVIELAVTQTESTQ